MWADLSWDGCLAAFVQLFVFSQATRRPLRRTAFAAVRMTKSDPDHLVRLLLLGGVSDQLNWVAVSFASCQTCDSPAIAPTRTSCSRLGERAASSGAEQNPVALDAGAENDQEEEFRADSRRRETKSPTVACLRRGRGQQPQCGDARSCPSLCGRGEPTSNVCCRKRVRRHG